LREETLGRLSAGELLHKLIGNLSALADRQVELAKQEAREEVKQRAAATAALVAGLTLLFLALLSLVVAAILALALVVPGWVAGVMVAVALAFLGGIAVLLGRSMMTKPLMPRTRRSLEEDVEWAKHLTSSNGR
jgi:uncharacterized membrane protein YqjE